MSLVFNVTVPPSTTKAAPVNYPGYNKAGFSVANERIQGGTAQFPSGVANTAGFRIMKSDQGDIYQLFPSFDYLTGDDETVMIPPGDVKLYAGWIWGEFYNNDAVNPHTILVTLNMVKSSVKLYPRI